MSLNRLLFSRRNFLRVGGLALGSGLLVDRWLPRLEAATPALRDALTGKSVVFLFQHGGPSQIETFDPKPDAPVEVRSVNGDIQTRIPGVRFGGLMPQLAELADRFTIVRSFVTGDGNHDIKPIVGRNSAGANIGSLYARVAGSNDPRTGFPTNLVLYPRSVDDSTGPEIQDFGRLESTGAFGAGAAPFVPGAGGDLQQNLELRLTAERLGDRRSLLEEIDRLRPRLREGRTDPLREQAFETLLAGIAGAFDLSKEDATTVERYDTAPLVRPDQIDRVWNNYNHYVDHAKSLGKLMLLARRMCEAGAKFVTVTTSFVWDMHSDVNNAPPAEGMRYVGTPFDHAVSAFLRDIEARGLSDRILLVCCGEMGRTPRLNASGGRDHWGSLAPLLLSGAGVPRGGVIGQSTRDAGEPQSAAVDIPQLVATILRTLFDVGQLRLVPGVPEEIVRLASGEPIPGIDVL
ncbi:MAG: DUF1501 domain-containing protein [Planctomyces sp.]|nr:DUF1501 domain-containing protein [Planctomyces sp.]